MNVRDISIIGVVLIWLAFIFILGMLALNFKRRHGVFMKHKNTQEDEFNRTRETFTLKEVKISYDLPEKEKCYFKNEAMLFLEKKKKNKQNSKYDRVLLKKGIATNKDDEDDFYDFKDTPFLKVFNTDKSNYRIYKKTFNKSLNEGKIYITNKRLMLIGNEHTYQFPLHQVKNILLSVFIVRGQYQYGIKLETKENSEDIYLTYTDINLYFTINKLLQN